MMEEDAAITDGRGDSLGRLGRQGHKPRTHAIQLIKKGNQETERQRLTACDLRYWPTSKPVNISPASWTAQSVSTLCGLNGPADEGLEVLQFLFLLNVARFTHT